MIFSGTYSGSFETVKVFFKFWADMKYILFWIATSCSVSALINNHSVEYEYEFKTVDYVKEGKVYDHSFATRIILDTYSKP